MYIYIHIYIYIYVYIYIVIHSYIPVALYCLYVMCVSAWYVLYATYPCMNTDKYILIQIHMYTYFHATITNLQTVPPGCLA